MFANDQEMLCHEISLTDHLITIARQQVRAQVNQVRVMTYWQIGELIVEEEQAGEARAEYGKAVLQGLSEQLTAQFGKGFDVRNLRNMRRFYLMCSNRNAVRSDLSWTHYRLLLRVAELRWRLSTGLYPPPNPSQEGSRSSGGETECWRFGSFRRGQMTPESDVDLLVEFQPGMKSFDIFMDLCFPG